MAKPTGAACNLDCSYCFFLSKEALWGQQGQTMSAELLRKWLENYLRSQPDGPVTINWQGGEPTLRGVDFFREAALLVDELKRPEQEVLHAIQTNATLIDDEWAAFFKDHGFLVGVSIDGPPALHDAYRVNKAGRGTHDLVVKGLRTLQRHDVDINILCTVNASNAEHPLEVYRHFRDDLGVSYLQFIPVVERVAPGQEAIAEAGWRDSDGAFVPYEQSGEGVTSRSVRPEQYGAFLVAIFDEWLEHDVGNIFVQDFDTNLGAMFGQYTSCVQAPQCGDQLAMEHNGDVYSCDHFVEPRYRLGNVQTDSLKDLLTSPFQIEFGRSKETALPTQCLECPVRWACNGGCPKDRFTMTQSAEPGLNYLCEGYLKFFHHTTPTMRQMALLLSRGRSASDIRVAANHARNR